MSFYARLALFYAAAVAAQVVIVPWAYGLELARLELERRGCGVDNLPDLTSHCAPAEFELERAA